MARHGKRYRADLQKAPERDKPLPLADAVNHVKAFKNVKFDQSIEVAIWLGIDAKQADQAVRGSVSLPHGIGKTKRVVAFCSDDKVAACKEAGAVEAGGEELVKKIEDGWLDFDVAVASPDMMRVVARLGRALGPKGLMPSPKSGTVTPNVVEAVRDYGAGKVEFRNDAGGNVHAVVGKQSFETSQLEENAQAFIDHIMRIKPAAAKGHYVKQIALSGTMTPGVLVEVP
ncbi:50S ribosomal protein L1 [Phycisphaerales bacterium AB-hyl4]|uniref:Large ribosomal subunit protein uL1 n=1 Tax=Natronomicrosphaera hydrolytica TaxID=3242702 RepID=A0ABV4U323_9BACT